MTSKYRPSNGFEGEMFKEVFCYRCKKYDEDGCEIESAAWLYDVDESEYPAAWQYDDDDEPICTVFEEGE